MQPLLKKYKPSGPQGHQRRFNYIWFNQFPSWLEYSESSGHAYCFFCFLCSKKYKKSEVALMSLQHTVLIIERKLMMGKSVAS